MSLSIEARRCNNLAGFFFSASGKQSTPQGLHSVTYDSRRGVSFLVSGRRARINQSGEVLNLSRREGNQLWADLLHTNLNTPIKH